LRIALFYPPDRTIPTMAYSSLSVLYAAMRKKGHEVMVMDLNLEITNLLVQKDRIIAFRNYVEEEFNKMEVLDSIPAGQRWRYEMFGMLMATPKNSLEGAEEGKKIMRDPDRFFDPVQFNRAFNDLSAGLRLIYAATPLYYPENNNYIKDCLAYLGTGPTDPIMEAYRNELVDKVLAFDPHIVGGTIPFHLQFIEALKFFKSIKEKRPDIKTVIGGTSVVDYRDTYFADNSLEGLVDFGILDDGEVALHRLAESLNGKLSIADVPNLISYNNKEVVFNPREEKLQDLNLAPTPDFTQIPFDQYLLPYPVVNMCTSRGCYYGKCAFCGDSFKRDFRMRKPELVFTDVKKIHKKHNIKFFYFWDSLAPPRTLRHLSRKIAEEKLDIKWFAETRLEKTYADLKFQQEMFKGGCRVLQFGYESGDQRVLDLMRKGNKIPVVKEIFTNMKKSGLSASCSWFIGFPTETEEEAWRTYKLLHEHRNVVALSVYTGTFMIGGDTDVLLNPDRYGINVSRNELGNIVWEHKVDFKPWDLKYYNEAFTARSDIVLLNHGCFVLYHSEKPDSVLHITGFGRIGRMAREINDLEAAKPFRPEGNRINSYKFDPTPGQGDLVPGKSRYLLAYIARSGWIFPADEITLDIFNMADGETAIGEMIEKLNYDKEIVLDHAKKMIDQGLIAGWIDLPY